MGMSRGFARFKESDIRRAINAVMKSGADMAVEIARDGTIKIARNHPDPIAPETGIARSRPIVL